MYKLCANLNRVRTAKSSIVDAIALGIPVIYGINIFAAVGDGGDIEGIGFVPYYQAG